MEILIKITDGKVEANLDNQSLVDSKKQLNGQNQNGTTETPMDGGLAPQWLVQSLEAQNNGSENNSDTDDQMTFDDSGMQNGGGFNGAN